MIPDYQHLIADLRKTLRIFNCKLLFCNLLKGGVIVGATVLLFFLFFYVYVTVFQVTVLWKTCYYYLFLFSVVSVFFLFILVPIYRFILYCFYQNDLLLHKILDYLPSSSDIFESVYNLAFHDNQVKGDDQLKKAAFVQKYIFLDRNNLIPQFPVKPVFVYISLLLLFFFLFFFNCHWIKTVYKDIIHYEIVQTTHKLSFDLLNKDLKVEYGEKLELKLKIDSDYQIDRVFICYGGGEFLMTKEDTIFTYEFLGINNDIQFSFKALDQQSDFYKIIVLPSPVITGYTATLIPPSYTGLKTEVQTNTVDFRVLYGSRLNFKFNLVDVDSLYLVKQGSIKKLPIHVNKSSDLNMLIRESGDYAIIGSNSSVKNKNLLNFTIACIPDLYPGIQISEMQDSLHSSIHYFYGVITDDFGFSALRFNYSLNEENSTVISIPVAKNVNTHEFYFSFDFAEFAGGDQLKIDYYFEVFDNDNLSGPKSTRSDRYQYTIPDLNTILDYNTETSHSIHSNLTEAEKLAGEIVTGVKELQKKMLDNSTDNWEKQQLSKDIVKKKNKLDKLLDAVKSKNLKKSDLNQNFAGQDSVLLSKQKQMQELLDRIMDDEMKNLMNEFSKLSEEFSKDQFKNLDEQMKLTFDQMSEELDRNIELLKRFQIEERHDLIVKQMDKLRIAQEKLENSGKERSVSPDSLSSLHQKVQENLKNVRENYEELLKDNRNLSQPFSLDDYRTDFENISRDVKEQINENTGNKLDKKKLEQIKKEIEDLSDKMKKQQEQNFVNKTLPENDIELIIQNILIISLSEEDLLKQFSKAESQSVKYNELGRLQDLKRQEYKIVKDSLSVLAKSNLMLASLLSHKFFDIEIKFGLLPGYIQNNRRSELAREQQYIINYLNDIALSLTDALQKSRQERKKSEDGDKKGSKKGEKGKSSGEGNGYEEMKIFQGNLKKQLEDLVSQMKKGEKGKPLYQGISSMIRENEIFKKSLNDFISESGSLSNTEKQLLNEINRLLDENINELANYSVSNKLVERNKLIYNKLIISEKASKQRDEYDEKRKSESAHDAHYKRPDIEFDVKKKSGFIRTDFYKSDLKLNDYFKTMYNKYYIKLGNE